MALSARGRPLLEDIPSAGKTILAHVITTLIKGELGRIQFTSDPLSSDMVDADVFNQQASGFESREGPVSENVILDDEISRAPPET